MGELMWLFGLLGVATFLGWIFEGFGIHSIQPFLTPENYALVGSVVWLAITLSLIHSRLNDINLVGYTAKWVKWREALAPDVEPEVAAKLLSELDSHYRKNTKLYGQFFSPRAILCALLVQSALWPVDVVVRPVYRVTCWAFTRDLFTQIWKVITLKGDDK